MLILALFFLALALTAGVMGFLQLAGLSSDLAMLLLAVFVVLSITSALSVTLRGRPPA